MQLWLGCKLVFYNVVPRGLEFPINCYVPRVETLRYNKAVPMGLRKICMTPYI